MYCTVSVWLVVFVVVVVNFHKADFCIQCNGNHSYFVKLYYHISVTSFPVVSYARAFRLVKWPAQSTGVLTIHKFSHTVMFYRNVIPRFTEMWYHLTSYYQKTVLINEKMISCHAYIYIWGGGGGGIQPATGSQNIWTEVLLSVSVTK